MYKNTAAMCINKFEYQVEDAVLIEAKKNRNYVTAHDDNNIILLLETIQNVVNKGECGENKTLSLPTLILHVLSLSGISTEMLKCQNLQRH